MYSDDPLAIDPIPCPHPECHCPGCRVVCIECCHWLGDGQTPYSLSLGGYVCHECSEPVPVDLTDVATLMTLDGVSRAALSDEQRSTLRRAWKLGADITFDYTGRACVNWKSLSAKPLVAVVRH